MVCCPAWTLARKFLRASRYPTRRYAQGSCKETIAGPGREPRLYVSVISTKIAHQPTQGSERVNCLPPHSPIKRSRIRRARASVTMASNEHRVHIEWNKFWVLGGGRSTPSPRPHGSSEKSRVRDKMPSCFLPVPHQVLCLRHYGRRTLEAQQDERHTRMRMYTHPRCGKTPIWVTPGPRALPKVSRREEKDTSPRRHVPSIYNRAAQRKKAPPCPKLHKISLPPLGHRQ